MNIEENCNNKENENIIEALLFASGEPIEIEEIAKAIDETVHATSEIICSLQKKYEDEKRGIVIVRLEDSYQISTNPIYFDYVKKVYGNTRKKPLTQALIETLAIIAYKQPITKSQIEHIRGVNVDHSVNKLVEYTLISECGRAETPGRPVLFSTTTEFLKYFGINDLRQLPAIDDDIEVLEAEAIEEVEKSFSI